MNRTRFSVLVLSAVEILVIGLGIVVVRATFSLDEVPCTPDDNFHGGIMVIAGAVAFLLGHLLGRVRHVSDRRPRPHPAAAGPLRSLETTQVLHIVLAGFFALGLALLVYEALSLRNPWGLRPITSYVRCARSVNPWVTGLFTGAISFLVGHWFWYPRRDGDGSGATPEAGA